MYWQYDLIAKPSINKILDLILANSAKLRKYEEFAK
jgi:hypothetical protein